MESGTIISTIFLLCGIKAEWVYFTSGTDRWPTYTNTKRRGSRSSRRLHTVHSKGELWGCFQCYLPVIFPSFLYTQRVWLENSSLKQIQNRQPPAFYPRENPHGHQALTTDGPPWGPASTDDGWTHEFPQTGMRWRNPNMCTTLNPMGIQGIVRTRLFQVVRPGWKARGPQSRLCIPQTAGGKTLSNCISVNP